MKNTNRNIQAFFIFFLFFTQSTNAQEFEWVKSTLEGNPVPSSIAVDNAGNIYAAGHFVSTLDFDPGPGVFNLTADVSGVDVYLYKLDTDGNFIWAKSIYGGGNDKPVSLDVSPDGEEVYLSGYFENSADFDPGVGTYLLESDFRDHFALKLDGDGNFIWAQSVPIEGPSLNSTISRDMDGNVLFTGVFTGDFDFDPDPSETLLLSAGGDYATFFQKLDMDGNLIWAKRVTNIKGNSAVISDDLSIFYTGIFSNETDFDEGIGEFLLGSEGSTDSFVLKLNATGSFNWAIAFIGDDWSRGEFIEVDLEGNIICSGMYWGAIDADPGISEFLLTSTGLGDHFFIKLDEFGELLWAKSIGSDSNDWPGGIKVNSENEIIISGTYMGDEIDLDPGIDESIVANDGGRDFYILKLDEEGNLIWLKDSEGNDNEGITDSAIDAEDKLYFIGQMSGWVDFDFCPYTDHTLAAISPAATYVLKLGSCEVFGDTFVAEECNSYTSPYGTTYTESGTYYEVLDGTCNCDSLITFDITIWTLDIIVTQVTNELTANEDAPEATYQWVNCLTDYTEIPDATDQSFIATEDGEYAVIVTVGACSDTSDCYEVKTQGIHSNGLNLDVSVFPNPTNGQFNIQFGKTQQSVELIMRNIAGEIISTSTHNSIQTIPMEIEAAKGIYFLEIKTDKGEQAFLKIICQ